MLLMPIEFPLSTEERAAYCEFIDVQSEVVRQVFDL